MSPYERRRTSNDVPGDVSVTHATENRGGKGTLGTWWTTAGRTEGTQCPQIGTNPMVVERGGKLNEGSGACKSVLNSHRPREDHPGTKRTMIANRTRENRPSGMTTGACGIVLHGSRTEAQREIFGNATEPFCNMRHRSIQTCSHLYSLVFRLHGLSARMRDMLVKPGSKAAMKEKWKSNIWTSSFVTDYVKIK